MPQGPGMGCRRPAPSWARPSLTLQYIIKTVEVESSKTKQALSESQTRNQHLQEQVAMQRQVLKEMEQQLQGSHQLTAQLRAQVRRPRGGEVHAAAREHMRTAEAGLWYSAAVNTQGSDRPSFWSLFSLLAV